MVGRFVGTIAAASALTAQAMLIPPGVESMDDSVSEFTIVNTKWQTVKLPCPDCVMPTPKRKGDNKETSADDAPVFIQGGANSLLVNVTTLFGDNAVGLDNYPLYPPLRSFNKPTVDMVPSDASMVELKKTSDRRHTVVVSADTSFVSEETVAPEGDAVIRVKYQIMSVDNFRVNVDAIEVTCLKDADQKMSILNAEAVPSASTIFDALPSAGRPSTPDTHNGKTPAPKKQCHMPAVVCQMRDFLEDKMSEFRDGVPKTFGGRLGCQGRKGKGHVQNHGGRLPTHIRPPHFFHSEDEVHRPEGHHGRPPKVHHLRPHHDGRFRHGHHHHSAFHGFVKGFLMVLVPIFLGITMGMAVSLIGMIVGRLIAWVWLRFVRGGRRGYASVRASEDEADKDEIESVISEPLPQYEEAPAYEEKERS